MRTDVTDEDFVDAPEDMPASPADPTALRRRRRRFALVTSLLVLALVAAVAASGARDWYLARWPLATWDGAPVRPGSATGAVPTLVPGTDDGTVRAACGAALGLDLSGWTIAVRGKADDLEPALLYGLRSRDGHGVYCAQVGHALPSIHGSLVDLRTSARRALVGLVATLVVQPCLPSLDTSCVTGRQLSGFGLVTGDDGRPDRRVARVEVALDGAVVAIPVRLGYLVAHVVHYLPDAQVRTVPVGVALTLHPAWRALDDRGTVVSSGTL